MNDRAISPLAYFCLLITLVLEVDFVTIGRDLAQLAGPDAWLSIAMGSVLFWVSSCLILKLSSEFDNETIFEYAPRMVGAFLGRILTLWLAIFWFLNAVRVTRGLSEGVRIFLLYTTPVPITAGLMIILCIYAVLQGIQALARSSQLFLAIIIATIGLISILSLSEFDISNFLPFLNRGLIPVAEGGIRTSGAFQGIELLLVLYPLINGKGHIRFFHYAATLFVSFAACLAVVISIGVFGADETGRLIWPYMTLVKTFAIPGRLLERMEPVLMVGTVVIAYTTIVMNIWLTGMAVSSLFPMMKPMAAYLAIGLGVFICSSLKVVVGTYAFLSKLSMILTWITIYAIPAFLLFIRSLRRYRHTGDY